LPGTFTYASIEKCGKHLKMSLYEHRLYTILYDIFVQPSTWLLMLTYYD